MSTAVDWPPWRQQVVRGVEELAGACLLSEGSEWGESSVSVCGRSCGRGEVIVVSWVVGRSAILAASNLLSILRPFTSKYGD